MPLTSDPEVIEPARHIVAALLPQLRALSAGIASLNSEIAARCQVRPDYQLFAELPGAGPVFASRLLAAFGEQPDRFANAAAFQKFAGIAPVTKRSGNKRLPSNGSASYSGAGSIEHPTTNHAT